MSTKKTLLVVYTLVVAAFLLTGCAKETRAEITNIIKSGIQFLGLVLVISALVGAAVLFIQGKINLVTGSSRGVSEVAMAVAAVFAGLLLGLLGPVIVDSIYNGLEEQNLITNEIPRPYAKQK